MFYSDEEAEKAFADKSTAYAEGILLGGVFATCLSSISWVIVIIYILYNNGYWG